MKDKNIKKSPYSGFSLAFVAVAILVLVAVFAHRRDAGSKFNSDRYGVENGNK